jgi:DNA-directed RNA polymerase subunit K/omega
MYELSEESTQLVARSWDRTRRAYSRHLFLTHLIGRHNLMADFTLDSNHSTTRGLNADLRELGSIYRMIIVTCLRNKQLVKGGKPRIPSDPLKRRSITIALEEVRRGLVPYVLKSQVGHLPPDTVVDRIESALG